MNGTHAREELDLSIVIPAYKESAKIDRDIAAASEFVRKQHLRAEIIVVDDGSPDDTAAKALAWADRVPELRVLSYLPNRGKGHALAYAMTRTHGRIVMFADSGLCVPYDIATIGMRMLELNMCDIAHGSRRMRGSVRRSQPLLRQIGSRGFSLLIHTLVGVPFYISDTQCGFKLYRREVAHKLYGELRCDGMMFDIDLVLLALQHKFRILEFPVLWSNDPDSRYDPIRGGAVKTLRELLNIRLRFMGLIKSEVKSAVTERDVAQLAAGTAGPRA